MALFIAGQLVSVSAMGRLTAPAGIYNIVRALPASPGSAQYRIKSDAEPFERIINEDRISEILNE
jgi:hypothetical protein